MIIQYLFLPPGQILKKQTKVTQIHSSHSNCTTLNIVLYKVGLGRNQFRDFLPNASVRTAYKHEIYCIYLRKTGSQFHTEEQRGSDKISLPLVYRNSHTGRGETRRHSVGSTADPVTGPCPWVSILASARGSWGVLAMRLKVHMTPQRGCDFLHGTTRDPIHHI